MKNSDVGRIGEDLASRYLVGRGYTIVDRNYRMVFGELDIIAKCVNSTLVFVEVKTMTAQGSREAILPEDQMTSHKISKLKRVAQFYANKHPELVCDARGWRIDVVAISLPKFVPGASKDFYSSAIVRHYENI